MVRTALRIPVHLNVSFAFSFLFVGTQTLGFAALSLECSRLSYLSAHKLPRQMALPQWQQALSNLMFAPSSPNAISKLQTWKRELKVNIVSNVSNRESSVVWLPGICLNSHVVRESEVKLLSHVQLFAMPWTVAYQVPPSIGFSRQEYWSGLPFPSPGGLSNPGIEPGSPAL